MCVIFIVARLVSDLIWIWGKSPLFVYPLITIGRRRFACGGISILPWRFHSVSLTFISLRFASFLSLIISRKWTYYYKVTIPGTPVVQKVDILLDLLLGAAHSQRLVEILLWPFQILFVVLRRVCTTNWWKTVFLALRSWLLKANYQMLVPNFVFFLVPFSH